MRHGDEYDKRAQDKKGFGRAHIEEDCLTRCALRKALLLRMYTYIRFLCPPALDGTWQCSRNGVHCRSVPFSEQACNMFVLVFLDRVCRGG
jgi:hypothetical protein